jgi:hypothetical protein
VADAGWIPSSHSTLEGTPPLSEIVTPKKNQTLIEFNLNLRILLVCSMCIIFRCLMMVEYSLLCGRYAKAFAVSKNEIGMGCLQ